jgi:hypothetical protein
MKLRDKFLLSAIALFILSACSASTLTYEKSKLNLKVDDKQLQIHGTQLKSNRENFSILYLDQRLLRLDDGSVVMYEYGQTDLDYEFANPTRTTMRVVFDARKIIEVYNHSFVYAYQMILSDGRVLNAVIAQNYDQEINMVYGMSSQKLDKMISKLNPNMPKAPYRNVITLENEINPLISKWTTWKINFVPLVQPLPRFIRM